MLQYHATPCHLTVRGWYESTSSNYDEKLEEIKKLVEESKVLYARGVELFHEERSEEAVEILTKSVGIAETSLKKEAEMFSRLSKDPCQLALRVVNTFFMITKVLIISDSLLIGFLHEDVGSLQEARNFYNKTLEIIADEKDELFEEIKNEVTSRLENLSE